MTDAPQFKVGDRVWIEHSEGDEPRRKLVEVAEITTDGFIARNPAPEWDQLRGQNTPEGWQLRLLRIATEHGVGGVASGARQAPRP